jgi:hypothetical protein
MKVSELEGAALDRWVAKANRDWPFLRVRFPELPWITTKRPYSTEWEYGGPIIEREFISTIGGPSGWTADARYCKREDKHDFDACFLLMDGPTPLIAAMRAYVARKYGEDVEDGD